MGTAAELSPVGKSEAILPNGLWWKFKRGYKYSSIHGR